MIATKPCARCLVPHPLTAFTKCKKGKLGRFSYCRKCSAQKTREWSKNNPEKRAAAARRQWLKVLYGITPEFYESLHKAQRGRCAICGGLGKRVRSDMRFCLHVDHDHATGRIRGLLCNNCNTVLGNAGDSVEVLQKAIAYLQG